jgi:predicted lipoprotein with Yx(FWY)xxD motif
MPHAKRTLAMLMVAVAGFALAAVAGLAVAKSFTLRVSNNVHVTNTPTKAFRVKAVDTHEAVAVSSSGFAAYTFQGETTHHLICKKTSSQATDCWAFWPPVTVNSAKGLSAQKGIKGKLGTFRNHGLLQVTLNGRPLYNFTPDITGKNKKQATGDELKTFGSIWHIVTASGGGVTHGTTTTSGSSTSTSGTSTGTTTTNCLYPPCY